MNLPKRISEAWFVKKGKEYPVAIRFYMSEESTEAKEVKIPKWLGELIASEIEKAKQDGRQEIRDAICSALGVDPDCD